MLDKKKKVFEKTFGILLSESGFDENQVRIVFERLLTASAVSAFYIDNEHLVGLFDAIRDNYSDEFPGVALEKVLHYLNNIRTGKFDSQKEEQDE